MSSAPTLIALLYGPDQPGLVARVSGWIFNCGGNILHADQHRDMEAGVFFQRIEWIPKAASIAGNAASVENEARAFEAFARSLGMETKVASSVQRPRIAVFVSKFDHCFHDLALRWKAGEFHGDIALIISNHPDLEAAASNYGLSFLHIPVRAEAKSETEAQQLENLRQHRIDLVVLARYMQVLSDRFLREWEKPVINIHHSFLPAFTGGRPYHQAYERGVKLIGATAHYATEVLDEGPIIHQDVARITHRHDVEDLIRRGRDLEKSVLAQAVAWHLENRILVYGRKTVVFD
ncbi:MAG TPA: formyltetrahydrofolate deformylase [Opitutaceae bacterium]|nr:formyltetrahydrofolate deformylase [Opitutaceae bacterium]